MSSREVGSADDHVSAGACWGRVAPYVPLFLVFMSGFGFSVQSLIIKVLAEHDYHGTFQLMFFRGGIQATLSSLFIMRDRQNGDTSKLFGDTTYASMVLLARTLLGFLGMTFAFLAVEYMPVADASVLVMQSPVLAAILSYFILGEPWRRAEFAATVVSMLGVLLISRPHFLWKYIDPSNSGADSNEHYTALGPLYGVLGALGASGSFVCVRMLGTKAKMPWANVAFAASLGQFLLSAPMIFMSGQALRLDMAWWKWALLLSGGVVGSFSQFAMTIGMQREKSASASAMRTSDVVFGFIWQALFTSDIVTWTSVMGAVCVTAGVMIIVLFKSASLTETNSSQSVEMIALSDSEGLSSDMDPGRSRTPLHEEEGRGGWTRMLPAIVQSWLENFALGLGLDWFGEDEVDRLPSSPLGVSRTPRGKYARVESSDEMSDQSEHHGSDALLDHAADLSMHGDLETSVHNKI